ncbi:MAG TPA: hypothetical protein VIJ77_04820 [Candidatus Tumulicola sp.]
MSVRARLLVVTAFSAVAAFPGTASSQTPPPPSALPETAPSASPSLPDPCGSLLSIVNRPTFGTGVCAVRTGHFDVENGYTNTVSTGPGGGSAALYPQSLIRVGTSDPHLDFEFGAPSEERSSLGGTATGGSTDASFGMKYELGYDAKALWGVSAVATVPSGARTFSAGNAQFTGNLNWGYSIDSELGLAGTLGFNAFSAYNAAGVAQSYFAFAPTLEVTAALPGGPSQLAAEYAYFSSAGPGLGGKSWFDFVYQRDFGPHVQFDVEYGFSPTFIGGQKQHYVGAGLSFMN